MAAAISDVVYPARVYFGQTGTQMSFVVRNTGDARWTFGVVASLQKPDNQEIVNLPLRAVTLGPGETRKVAWEIPQWRPAGYWDVRASVWRETGSAPVTPLADTGWLADVVRAGFWVRYHESSVGITEGSAQLRLAGAQILIRQTDGAGDVACEVTMEQFSTPSSFTTGDGIIGSQGEFNAVIAVPGTVKIVHQITWCNAIGAGIVGCAPTPGYSFVVREPSPQGGDQELWGHEYGHSVGLSHVSSTQNLMFATYNAEIPRRKVTADQCAAFLGGPSQAAIRSTESAAPSQAVPIRAFVRQVHYHGVPYAEAGEYSPSDVPVLLGMLADPAETPYWTNVVAMLGMVGDESVVAPLIAFAREGTGRLTPDAYRARSTVLLALGYLVNRTRSRVALDFLIASARPATWKARSLRWTSPFHVTDSARNERLSRTALLGLALTGHAEAGPLLRREPRILQEFESISRRGLRGYYTRLAARH